MTIKKHIISAIVNCQLKVETCNQSQLCFSQKHRLFLFLGFCLQEILSNLKGYLIEGSNSGPLALILNCGPEVKRGIKMDSSYAGGKFSKKLSLEMEIKVTQEKELGIDKHDTWIYPHLGFRLIL